MEYFSEIFSFALGIEPTVDRSVGLSFDSPIIKKEANLQVLQHLNPDKNSGHNDVYTRIIKSQVDKFAGPLGIPFDLSFNKSTLPRDGKDSTISPHS